MANKIKVSMKGLHDKLDSIEARMLDVESQKPGMASVANIRSLIKQLRTATRCQVNMVAEF